jgi:hypothetical protein
MITKYYGVFCAHCGHFIKIHSYQVERPEIIIDFWTNGDDLTCPKCKQTCTYHKVNIAHSLSPDGTDPQYSHKR